MSAPNVATFWKQATEGVTYYRCYLPGRHLPGQVLGLEPTDLQQRRDGTFHFPRQEGDVAIWSFPGNTTRGLLISEMQNVGIRCFFEADDNYTIPPSMPQISSWQIRYTGNDQHSYEIATKISKFCDGVIVSTPELAKVYRRYNKNVHVARNCIEPADWEEPVKPDDGILRIGWAASDSHYYDAALLERALGWAADQPNVEVVIMGISVKPWRFKHTHVGWTESLGQYRRSLSKIDVMLCPLKRTAWTDCKSDIKALEAAMAGAAPVVSESPAFDVWQDRTYTAADAKGFLKVVKHIVRNREEVPRLAKEAKDYVLAERTIKKGVKAWQSAISSS